MLLECAQLPNERNTLGGIISGVPTGTSVVLANGREDLPLTADGGFTFTTPLAAGSAYAVTVKTQSQGTGCVVRNGTGVIGAASVDTVAVRCAVLGSLAAGFWEQDQCVPGPDGTGLKNGWSLSQARPVVLVRKGNHLCLLDHTATPSVYPNVASTASAVTAAIAAGACYTPR